MPKALLIIFALLLALPSAAQSRNAPRVKYVTQRNGLLYTERFQVLVEDNTVRHGKYALLYKGKAIERGQYTRGERSGKWTFYNMKNYVELVYDYDRQIPLHIQPHEGTTYNAKNFPPVFLGSPLVPYHFVAVHAKYPYEEQNNREDCKVVLALEINSNGRMTGFHLQEESPREEFNEIVRNTAAQMPDSWRWVPSRSGGKNVPANYLITIIFDKVDEDLLPAE